ncbi:MAG: hypothetical protein HEEMFOPI_01932 [Holosporales bacterium]
MLSERTINRITKTLIDKKAIDVLKLSSDRFKRTNYITILYENLSKITWYENPFI